MIDVNRADLSGIQMATGAQDLSTKLKTLFSQGRNIAMLAVHVTNGFQDMYNLLVFTGLDAQGNYDLGQGVAMEAPCPPFCGKGDPPPNLMVMTED